MAAAAVALRADEASEKDTATGESSKKEKAPAAEKPSGTEKAQPQSLWALEAAARSALEPAAETPEDLAFFALLEASVLISWHTEAAHSVARHVDGARHPDENVVKRLQELGARVNEALAARREKSRFHRLACRLELSKRETRLLEVLFVNHVSNFPEIGEYGHGLTRRSYAPSGLSPYRLSGMTPLEALAFTKSERLHVQQSIVLVRELGHGSTAVPECTVSPLMAKFAICGDLSDNEALKLEGTVIGQLLQEERQEQNASSASTAKSQKSAAAESATASLGAALPGAGLSAAGKGPVPFFPAKGAGKSGMDIFDFMADVTASLEGKGFKGKLAGKRGADELDAAPPPGKAARMLPGITMMPDGLDLRAPDAVPVSLNELMGVLPSEELAEEEPEAPAAGLNADAEMATESTGANGNLQQASGVVKETEPAAPGTGTGDADKDKSDSDDEGEVTAYASELSYLSDQLRFLECKILLTSLREKRRVSKDQLKEVKNSQYDDVFYFLGKGGGGNRAKVDEQIRELQANSKLLQTRIAKRMELAQKNRPWKPKITILAEALKLHRFEIDVILALLGATLGRLQLPGGGGTMMITAFDLLKMLCPSLKEQVENRKYFTKDATLLREGLVTMAEGDLVASIQGEWSRMVVNLDRRAVDFIIGSQTKLSEVVEGSHLYTPTCRLDNVQLPSDVKDKIVGAVSSFEEFQALSKEHGLSDGTYGNGMVLLFYGPSGTGKTMMANALCAMLQKKLLLINFPTLGNMASDVALKFIFREAKIGNAIVFFDECDSLFEDRDRGVRNVNMLLTEIERYNGLVFMATNRPQEIDEAMLRRITLAVEFRKPDANLREEIWKTLVPKKLLPADGLGDGWKTLAMDYELTGGLIKQAIACALSMAITKKKAGEEKEVVVTLALLREGARAQLKGRLRAKDLHRVRTPTKGLESMVLEEEVMEKLRCIVHHEKARECLCGSWGFDHDWGNRKGIVACFSGEPGTGKTAAAEAIAFSLGRRLKLINSAEVLSKWLGESGKNIDSIFEEARGEDAVLVFDEAEGLFGSRASGDGGSASRHDTVNTGLLLYHLENYSGIVVLCTNLVDKIDSAFYRRFSFQMEFKVPSSELRRKLWRQLLPAAAPLSNDVDFASLAREFEIPGAMIKQAVFGAATRAALRTEKRCISQADLRAAAEAEMKKGGHKMTTAARMMFA